MASQAREPVCLTLLLVDANQELAFEDVGEITLGRSAAQAPGRVEVDLSPYEAYRAGVSRQHARILLEGAQTTVTDLGSANGTRLNGRLLDPLRISPLKDADILTLGTLKIQIKITAKSSGRA